MSGGRRRALGAILGGCSAGRAMSGTRFAAGRFAIADGRAVVLTVALAAAACLLASCGQRAGTDGEAATDPTGGSWHGPLVAVGGALGRDHEAVYRAILDRRLDGAPLCVIPTASADPERSMTSYVEDFNRYGGDGAAVGVAIRFDEPAAASDPEVVAALESCGGFFFTGGDQSRIVDVFRPGGEPTPADEAVRRAWREGAVVSGSSAGAAMMSDPMIGAGTSAGALDHGVSASEDGPGVWVRDGMGFFAGGLTGQHHLARGRFGRLMVAVAYSESYWRGFGIDEDTAMVVERGTVRVIGRSRVAIYERQGDPGAPGGDVRGTLTLLGDGDSFDLRSGAVTRAADKVPLAAGADVAAAPVPPEDPWHEDALHRFLLDLARSDAREAAVRTGRHVLTFEKGDGFASTARADGADASTYPDGWTAGPFRLTWTQESGRS